MRALTFSHGDGNHFAVHVKNTFVHLFEPREHAAERSRASSCDGRLLVSEFHLRATDSSIKDGPSEQDNVMPSIGSRGHPHRCEEPCKFVWKNRGCRDGVNCLRCHLCRPSRSQEASRSQGNSPTFAVSEANLMSTQGKAFTHLSQPSGDSETCSPCDSDLALDFNLTETESTKDTSSLDGHPDEASLTPPEPLELDEVPPSLGSYGHPNGCGSPCKYIWKKRGCRDGPNCSHCHLCPKPPQFGNGNELTQGQPRTKLAPKRWSVGSTGHPHSCSSPCKYNSKKAGCKDGKLCDRCHICRWKHGMDGRNKIANDAPLSPSSRATESDLLAGEMPLSDM